MRKYELIANENEFNIVLQSIYDKNIKSIAIDLEGDYFRFRYGINLCLIQLLIDNRVYIIDAFIIEKWDLFKRVMEDSNIEKVFYSCLFDIKVLKTVLDINTKNIFDLFLAAIHLGITNNSLKNILNQFLNVDFTKNKDLQLSNWNLRPLTNEQMEYASNDVQYLIVLKDAMLSEIQKQKPKQQKLFFDKMKKIESDTEIFFKDKIKKLTMRGRLNNEEKIYLINFYNVRDNLAKEIDVAPHHIISDGNLIHASKNRFMSKEDWIKSSYLSRSSEEIINIFVKAGEASLLELKNQINYIGLNKKHIQNSSAKN